MTKFDVADKVKRLMTVAEELGYRIEIVHGTVLMKAIPVPEPAELKSYKVGVSKRMYSESSVLVAATSEEDAESRVNAQIALGHIHINSLKWCEPIYEDFSFEVSGDVEEIN
jgi:hypothetical protein